MKIVAIVAHPDDAETHCAGTLIKYRKQGHAVEIIHACTGDKGYYNMEESLRKTLRVSEAKKAGEVADISVSCLGFGDGELEYNHKNMTVVQDAICRAKPDLIFTHPTNDYHLDHVTLSKLVIDASFTCSVPLCCVNESSVQQIPQIYFIDSYAGVGSTPTEYVDITDTFADKIAMMQCHKSQLEWLQQHDNLDILHFLQVCAEYRGFQCGVKYAEGFTRYLCALRAAPGHFLP